MFIAYFELNKGVHKSPFHSLSPHHSCFKCNLKYHQSLLIFLNLQNLNLTTFSSGSGRLVDRNYISSRKKEGESRGEAFSSTVLDTKAQTSLSF